ncbi:putative procollagen-proline 4-dioxygenase [Helianthus annuus]|nr:putative procollagen-proline 4-dioxygenase [Helianthus annuus]KAJ0658248.1 putative procollagen-proline 4-dioxygenase [Helianthus annuus]KAJ0661920.1 putative procollagen-proline 4-dioxygenase [Helianthus annuus]
MANMVYFLCCHSRKELRTKEINRDNVIQLGRAVPSNTIDPSRVTELSWRPRSTYRDRLFRDAIDKHDVFMDRVFLYKGFLSDEECEHLISLVRPYSIRLLGIYICVAPHENESDNPSHIRL